MPNGEENDTPFVRITNREIWEEIRGLSNEVHDMRGAVKAVLDEHKDTKTRLRALELKVYTVLAGVGAAAVGGLGVLIKAMTQ